MLHQCLRQYFSFNIFHIYKETNAHTKASFYQTNKLLPDKQAFTRQTSKETNNKQANRQKRGEHKNKQARTKKTTKHK
jgi:hypothetical protein